MLHAQPTDTAEELKIIPKNKHEEILDEFHSKYKTPIVEVFEDYLRGPAGRSADAFKKVSETLLFRAGYFNTQEKNQLRHWFKQSDLHLKSEDIYTAQDWIVYGIFYEQAIISPEENIKNAISCFEKGIQDPLAYILLGNCWLNPWGDPTLVEQNFAKATEYFELGKKSHEALALYGLGWKLRSEENYKEAMQHFLKSAELGNVYALEFAGYFYYEGIGFKKNKTKAVAYFEDAARRGSGLALTKLGDYYHYRKQPQFVAMLYYAPAADRGCEWVFREMSEICSRRGGKENQEKSRDYTNKAAESGFSWALFKLATKAYEQADYKKAEDLYLKATNAKDGQYANVAHRILAKEYQKPGIFQKDINLELAAKHTRLGCRNEYLFESDTYELLLANEGNPNVCYHNGVVSRYHLASEKRQKSYQAFTRVLNDPAVDINSLCAELKDTPYLLKPLIGEPAVLQVLTLAEVIKALPISAVEAIVLEYAGPISSFALQVVKEEKMAASKLSEIKDVVVSSRSLFTEPARARCETAFDLVAENKMCRASAFEYVLNISEHSYEMVFRTLFYDVMELQLKTAKPEDVFNIGETILQYFNLTALCFEECDRLEKLDKSSDEEKESKQDEHKESEILASRAITHMKGLLTGCDAMFGKTAVDRRLKAIAKAERKEINSVVAFKQIFGMVKL